MEKFDQVLHWLKEWACSRQVLSQQVGDFGVSSHYIWVVLVWAWDKIAMGYQLGH
jgi:hypothetical protein